MKYVLVLVLCATGQVLASGEGSNFTPEYLANVRAEEGQRQVAAETFESRERDKKEHEKYLRQLDRTDRRLGR